MSVTSSMKGPSHLLESSSKAGQVPRRSFRILVIIYFGPLGVQLWMEAKATKAAELKVMVV